MAKKKSRGFGELLKQQRNIEGGQRSLKKFQREFSKSPLSEITTEILVEPAGVAKMSDVLDDFIAPYKADDITLSQYQNLLGIGVIAWNLAILDQQASERETSDARHKILKQLRKEGLKDNDPTLQKDVESIIDEMIARKKEFFADNQRRILSYQLEDLGTEFHLSVASTLKPRR
ncbi:MAG: hypothetical protein DCF15_05520 [Phormidesmis priestleyi]|uniref:Uncharacterized protein n=1 Tax=Phormidesmis priestleyi TaxID=268141 RepID=A0A2W4XQU2_9CYAN|nr:MAG: hypothetical protein DCF15_05520 [Phormidesmis priestleyi]